MSPELEALASRAVAAPGWRWMPGMLTGWLRLTESDAEYAIGHRDGWYDGEAAGLLPDLTDPATLGCLLALVRERHGRLTVARHVGTDGRGGQEWAVCDRAPDGCAAAALYGYGSEAEALVAALEVAP